MGRQAHAQAAYDIGQRIMSKTRAGSKISDSYMAKLTKSNTEKSKKKPALTRPEWLKSDAKGRGMGVTEYMQRGYGGGYSKYLASHRKGPTAPRGKAAINRDWFYKSGQNKLLGKKGATIVFRDTVKTWKETFPHAMGPPKEVYEEWQKAKGLVPGGYTYSTMTYAKDYSYAMAKKDREQQAYHSKKSRKKSGIGGIIGIGIDMLKTGLRNPKRLLMASPLSSKLWNTLTGDDIKPLTTQMGGPSQKSFSDYEKHTGRKVTASQRKFFKAADAIAGVVGGVITAGVLAPLATTAAGGLTAAQVAAGGVQTLGGAIAGGATTGAVMGFANVAGSGTESTSAMFKGAAMGGITGGLQGGFMQATGLMEKAAANTRAAKAAKAAAAAGGTNMSLWDTATNYFTTASGGADWGNILGAAGQAASIYGQLQGASAQKSAAKKANKVAEQQYTQSKAQTQRQFSMADKTLGLRIAQQQAINKERGQVRDEIRTMGGQNRQDLENTQATATRRLGDQFNRGFANLNEGAAGARTALQGGYDTGRGALAQGYSTGRGDLGRGYKTARSDLNAALRELRGSRDRSRQALGPMINESDATRKRQMGLLGIGGHQASLEQSEGYKFRMEEAMRGAERGLAGTGGSRSGRAAIELQERAQGLAQQYFDTHMDQLSNFGQAGVEARGSLANLESDYGLQLAQGRGSLADLASSQGLNMANLASGYGQDRANLAGDFGRNMADIQNQHGMNRANYRQRYGSSAADLQMQRGQNLVNNRNSMGQLQAMLTPGVDKFNSQWGQVNPQIGANVAGTQAAVGQSQSNMANMVSGGLSLLGSAFGEGGLFNNSGYNSNYNQSSNLGSSQAGYGSGYMDAWVGGL